MLLLFLSNSQVTFTTVVRSVTLRNVTRRVGRLEVHWSIVLGIRNSVLNVMSFAIRNTNSLSVHFCVWQLISCMLPAPSSCHRFPPPQVGSLQGVHSMPANGSVSKMICMYRHFDQPVAMLYVACYNVSKLEYFTQFVKSDISVHIV